MRQIGVLYTERDRLITRPHTAAEQQPVVELSEPGRRVVLDRDLVGPRVRDHRIAAPGTRTEFVLEWANRGDDYYYTTHFSQQGGQSPAHVVAIERHDEYLILFDSTGPFLRQSDCPATTSRYLCVL